MADHPTISPEEFKSRLAEVLFEATLPQDAPFKPNSIARPPQKDERRFSRIRKEPEEVAADTSSTTYRLTYTPKSASGNLVEIIAVRTAVKRETRFHSKYEKFDDGRVKRVIRFSEETKFKGQSIDFLKIDIEEESADSEARISRLRRTSGMRPYEFNCRIGKLPEAVCQCVECELRRLFSY